MIDNDETRYECPQCGGFHDKTATTFTKPRSCMNMMFLAEAIESLSRGLKLTIKQELIISKLVSDF